MAQVMYPAIEIHNCTKQSNMIIVVSNGKKAASSQSQQDNMAYVGKAMNI